MQFFPYLPVFGFVYNISVVKSLHTTMHCVHITPKHRHFCTIFQKLQWILKLILVFRQITTKTELNF